MELAPPERWSRIEALFAEALELSPAERRILLDGTRATDEALYRDLSRLLAAHETAGPFMEALDGDRAAALLRADPETAEPESIGPYRVVRRLGQGGMGVVHLAHDPRLDRPVALKLLRPHLTADGGARDRLLREARAASALDHPNIATVYEVGETGDGGVFIAMAYCPGESLADRIARGPVPPREAAGLARQLAEGLAAAHRAGVVHRDVKPGNLLVSEEGRLRIVDFGVARVAGTTEPGGREAAGTVAYMSPEQARGLGVDPRTDLWALGVVLHEMLTGSLPFRGESRPRLVAAILDAEPPPLGPGVPAPLARIVERCLAKERVDRPRDALEVSDALKRFLDGGASEGDSSGGLRVAWRFAWRAAAGLAAVGMVAAAAVAGFRGLTGGERAPGVPRGALAVLPLVPASPDTALERLGRELVVTLSATLDGMGDVRTVEPVAVLGQPVPGGGWTAAEGVRTAGRLGAGSFLLGSLTRRGEGVLVDLALRGLDESLPRVRASTEVASLDVAAVSDSATLALLRAGRVQEVPVADPMALQTSSVAALEAYLEGELAVAAGRFRTAPEAFLRAIREDSTFWYAYWRYAYARSYHGLEVDSAVAAVVWEHRDELPEADRLLIEARAAGGLGERLERLRAATGRFPTHAPVWFELGDQLVHHGPYLGSPARETVPVLEKVVTLQPSFVPAMEHLLWIAAPALDTAVSRRMVDRLVELRLDTLARTEWDLGTLDLYRYLDHLARTGGEPDGELAGAGVALMEEWAGPWAPERFAPSLTKHGFHRAQLDLGRRIAGSSAPPPVKAAYRWASALAWAGRGAWDSARVAARDYARASTHPRGALWAYGLVVAGAWLGAVEADSALAVRALAAASAEGVTADGRAELEWLGGLAACARGDGATLGEHRRNLSASSGAHAARLAASLAALETALAGGEGEAARDLADRQWADADRARHYGRGSSHPFLDSVERLAAARGLVAAGDTAEASRLLLWHESDLPGGLFPLPSVNIVVGAAALPRLASLHDARGFTRTAETYRERFRLRHDRAAEAAPRLGTGICGGA